MAAVQDGDQDAYRALLEAVQPVVHRYVRKRIRSPEAAEDVSQDVLMTMHRVRHTYERARPFEPWLYAIARSRVIDHLRKERRLSGYEVMMDVLPEVADAGAETTAEQVFAVLDKLPAAQREAFSMLKLEGLTTEEAAQRAGVTVSALKVRAHRAYKVLRTAFSREEKQ
jgi:RNA polymerase sigma-70 factor (ECF subfamily)